MFDLDRQPVRIVSGNMRSEKHGDEEHPAIDIGIEFDATNALLDVFGTDLRRSLFKKAKAAKASDQQAIAGVEPVSDLAALRNPEIESAIKLHFDGVGYTFEILEGLNDQVVAQYSDCKVNEIKVTPLEGGTVTMRLRIQSSKVDPGYTGVVHRLIKQTRPVMLTPPAQDAQTPVPEAESEEAV